MRRYQQTEDDLQFYGTDVSGVSGPKIACEKVNASYPLRQAGPACKFGQSDSHMPCPAGTERRNIFNFVAGLRRIS